MLDKRGMLSDRARGILFWFTITMIIVVAVIAVITILRACRSLVTQVAPPITISPSVIDLCAGEQHQFTVEDGDGVTWEATGGAITQSGLFTAGDVAGDYTVTVTGRDSGESAEATVRVIICEPTATPVPPPTPVPTDTPTPEAIASPSADPQGDVGTYEDGTPVEGAPSGMDIKDASVGADLRVVLQPTENVPAELAGWAGEGDVLLWFVLHNPVGDPPGVYINWLFALDIDGNTATGRPVGSRRINPDLGDEVVVGVTYNPTAGAYEPYALIWDTAQGNWAEGPDVRYTFDESRTLLAFALPLDGLTGALSQVGDVTIVPDAAKGRAAVDSYVGEQRVIDFYPDLPQ
jgi:hypothetical protein